MNRLVIFLFFLIIGGCAATREPVPVQTTRPGDTALTCEEILIEYTSNVQIAAQKIKTNQDNDVNDFLLGVLVWPGLADFKNADGIEGNALLDRCVYLKNLASSKNCDMSKFSNLPARYK